MKRIFTLLISLMMLASLAQASGPFFSFSGQNDFVNLRVFPNPSTSGDFTVQFDMNSSTETAKIKVYNLVGRQVFAKQVGSSTGQYKLDFSVSTLPKGVYMLEVVQGDRRITRRLSFI